MLHVWVEGEGQGPLNVSTRRVRISADHTDLGVIHLPPIPHGPMPHDNEYGQKYDTREPDIYYRKESVLNSAQASVDISPLACKYCPGFLLSRFSLPASKQMGDDSMPNQKPCARLENWAVVESANSASYQMLRAGSLLAGKVFSHPRIGEGTFIFTSPIVRLDEKTECCGNKKYLVLPRPSQSRIHDLDRGAQGRRLGELENSRKHFCCRSENDLFEGVGVERLLRTHVGGAYAALVGDVYQSRGGINGSRSAYHQQASGAIEFSIDTFHVQGNFAEPHNVGTNRRAAFRTHRQICSSLVEGLVRKRNIAFHAARLEEGSVHVMEAKRSGTLVEIIDVLRAEIKTVTQFAFNISQSQMCRIRFYSHGVAATHGIEAPHQFAIGMPSLGRGHLLDPVPIPQPTRTPEGSKPALRRDTGAGENEEAVLRRQLHGELVRCS